MFKVEHWPGISVSTQRNKLHEELSQNIGHTQEDEEAVEDGRGPVEITPTL